MSTSEAETRYSYGDGQSDVADGCGRLRRCHQRRTARDGSGFVGPVCPATRVAHARHDALGPQVPAVDSADSTVACGDFLVSARSAGRMAGSEHDPRTSVGVITNDRSVRFERDADPL